MIANLVLQHSWNWYPVDGVVELVCPRLKKRYRFSGFGEEKHLRIFQMLRQGVAENEAANILAAEVSLAQQAVQKLLDQLLLQGSVIRVPQEPPQDPVFDRQVNFFRNFATTESPAVSLNERLRNSRVLIAGLGGNGSWLAMLAARHGIRQIVGVDPDVIEDTNLNRQVYPFGAVGRKKVDACKEMVESAVPDVTFEGHERWITSVDDLAPLLAGVDLILSGVGYDLPEEGSSEQRVLQHVVEASLATGVPVLHCGGQWLGPLTVPGTSACLFCARSNQGMRDMIRATTPVTNDQPTSAIASRIGMTACLAMWEAVRFLSGMDRPPSLSGILMFDTYDYTNHQTLPLEPSCDRCKEIIELKRSA